MNALVGHASSRFLFVSLLPSLGIVAFVAFLVGAGAPDASPTLENARAAFEAFSLKDFFGLLLISLIVSVATHPLQYTLIQLMEGYWLNIPLGCELSEYFTRRYMKIFTEDREVLGLQVTYEQTLGKTLTPGKHDRTANSNERTQWLPLEEELLLPTSLGNALRAGEIRAGARYGMDVADFMPRLAHVMRPEARGALQDRRDQLDAAARLCAVAVAAIPISMLLLLPTGKWLFVPLFAGCFAWLSYSAAVRAAKGFCIELAAVFDTHHLDLWATLGVPVPKNLAKEKSLAELIGKHLRAGPLTEKEERKIVWVSREPSIE